MNSNYKSIKQIPNNQQQQIQMEQHYQVINLHNIIRSQEAKIQQLREELRIVNEREQIRYAEFIKNNKSNLEQKDRMIEFLKAELEKCQKNAVFGATDITDRHEKERQKMEKQLIAQKRKCIELEAKLKRTQNQYEIQVDNLTQQQRKTTEQLKRIQEAKTSLSLEITKLNHHYKTSLFEIGKRKETLLWVDKFTQYLESSQLKQKRTLQDVSSFVKAQIHTLRNNLSEMVTQIVKNQTELHSHKNSINKDIVKESLQLKQQMNRTLQQSEQFWTQIIKQEKDLQKNEEIKHLQSQLEKVKTTLTTEVQQLKSRLKSSESQKKTVILGFQQLRSLTQQKQSNYRQEIKHLKKTIEELIESATERDKQFESQLRVLTGQIENISERYYENIENPARKANIKFSQQIQEVKNMLAKIQENQWFKKSIENIEKYIQSYSENSQAKSRQFQEYFSQSNHMLEEIFQLVTNGRDSSTSKTFTSRVHTFQKQLEEVNEEEQVVLKQKLNKSQYQIVLAKKHLSKLKEYCENLQKKSFPKENKKADKSSHSQRIMELEAQNEALKECIQYMKKQHIQEKQILRRKFQIKSTTEQAHLLSQHNLKSSISRISQILSKVHQAIKKEHQNISEIKQNLKLMKTAVYKPLHSLELLISSGTSYLAPQNPQPGDQTQRSQNMHTHRSYYSVFSMGDEMKNYKQILSRRNQIHQNTNKMITELIRVLRESSSKESRGGQIVKKQQQPSNKRSELKLRNIEKRLRQIQTQRLKDKQQHIERLDKLQQNMDKLSQKISKSSSLKSTLNKFESNLDNKINQIINRTQIKLDKTQIVTLKDEVIIDLRSKLQQSNMQTEGLRKQMSVLLNQRKNV